MTRTKTDQKSIPEFLNRNMSLYTATAIAAGVGLLALAQPAESEVVITKKTIPIPFNEFDNPPQTIQIDLNHDGTKDFSFSLYGFAYHSFHSTLRVTPLEGGAVVNTSSRGRSYASALMRGAKIGASAQFGPGNSTIIEGARGFDASSHYSRHLYGKWSGNPVNRYLGVKFLINGQAHYGWVRLTVTTEPRGLSAQITAYAYETVANKKILAGISGKSGADSANVRNGAPSLGMLALGIDGAALWRKEQ